MKNPKISLYDSTLRDGIQMPGVSFSQHDKFIIIKKMTEELEIPYIEVYPFSNPKDRQLIQYIKEKDQKYLNQLVAFGSTRRVQNSPEEDKNLISIIDSDLKTCTIFGKSWDFHLQFIHATNNQNLHMIEDSVAFLKEHKKKVFYDAEHFFDGYKANKTYALQTLKAAERGGADVIVLCDTNGGTLPYEIKDIITNVLDKINVPLGIH
ncbi:MAG: citramalate synthase, partial [Promethearchaeota archaeon]